MTGLIRALQAAVPPGAAASASQAVPHDRLDSVVVHSPVPDPLIPIVQFIFQQPGWLLGLEMVLGGAAAAVVVWYLWTRRLWMFGWFRKAPRGAQVAFVGANLAVVAVALGTGLYAHDYAMHDNDFCKGCHIFVPSGQAWVRPDTGNYLLVNALEGKHDTLTCHSCHPFELAAQTKELFFWIADRPDKVPPHGRVPQAVCERCHVQGEARESWQQISATAGHSLHLVQDSTREGGRIQCLTCHARSAHRFEARDSTCTMSGCHEVNGTIKLGRMAAQQTSMHCTLCHEFKAEHAAEVSTDSAKTLLIPGGAQCTACHGMQQLTARFDFSKDPHQAKCGSCHNPHRQERPRDADSTCASCHKEWRTVPFHTGAIHQGHVRPTACTQCHQPHAARVDASDCTGCHTQMREVRDGRREIIPPLPFDTTATLRTSAVPPTVPPPHQTGAAPPAERDDRSALREHPVRAGPEEGVPRGKGDAPPADEPLPSPADSFEHARHQRLPCLTCHDPRSNKKLTFEPGRGCQICHHQAPDQNNCATCHAGDELAALRPTATVTVTVANTAALARPVAFDHAAHTSRRCVECHTTPVTLAPAPAAAACASCHDQHATTTRCASCHAAAAPFAAHRPPADAHRACAACHQAAIVAGLRPTRPLCLTCHAPQQDHKPGAECTTCHMQALPSEYRAVLTQGGAR
ncbi:MAG TPA: cytochrome c3 family protein [Gemmatimonadales bacterium]|nr:cytochrome c3 family protein [Gemmatimonadales bacterium]